MNLSKLLVISTHITLIYMLVNKISVECSDSHMLPTLWISFLFLCSHFLCNFNEFLKNTIITCDFIFSMKAFSSSFVSGCERHF